MKGDGPGRTPLRSEASVEHDEDQRGGADPVGEDIIVKRDFDDPVDAEDHAEQDEGKQGRNAELPGDSVKKYRSKDDDGNPK